MASDVLSAISLDIRSDLARVEDGLRSAVDSAEPMVREPALHLLEAGGKRFRPMLVLLCGHLGDPRDDRLVPCAVAIELTHLATLYHDDVIDEASVRRGVPSVNARFGNRLAILAGDYLFARSSGIAADLGPVVSRILADTIAELCEGQIMESEGSDGDGGAEHYLSVIDRKTAALIATSCRLGAWLGGAPDDVVAAAAAYGRALGMAFQLSDDVLDIAGDPDESGKVPGTDLREGVLTLPVLETLAGRVPGAEDLRAALGSSEGVDRALELLRANGSIAHSLRVVEDWSARAREALSGVPEGPGREALHQLASFVVDRTG